MDLSTQWINSGPQSLGQSFSTFPYTPSLQNSPVRTPKGHRKTYSLIKPPGPLVQPIEIAPDEVKHIGGCDIRIVSHIKKSIDIVLKDLDLSKIQSPRKSMPFSARITPMSVGHRKEFKFEEPQPTRKYLNSPVRVFIKQEDINRDGPETSPTYLQKSVEQGSMDNKDEGDNGMSFGEKTSEFSIENDREDQNQAFQGEKKMEPAFKKAQSLDQALKEAPAELEEGSPLFRNNTEKVVKLPLLNEVPEENQEIVLPLDKADDNPYSIKITLSPQSQPVKSQGKLKHYYVRPPPDKSPTPTERTLAVGSKDQEFPNTSTNTSMETPKLQWPGVRSQGASGKSLPGNMDSLETPKQIAGKTDLLKKEVEKANGVDTARKHKGTKMIEEEGENDRSRESIRDGYDRQKERKWTNFSLPSDDGNMGRPEGQKRGSLPGVGKNKGYFIDIPVKPSLGEIEKEKQNLRNEQNGGPQISWSTRRLQPRLSLGSRDSDTLHLDGEDFDIELTDETERLRNQIAEKDAQINDLIEIFAGLEKRLGDLQNLKDVGNDVLEEAAITLKEGISQILNAKEF